MRDFIKAIPDLLTKGQWFLLGIAIGEAVSLIINLFFKHIGK
jgi:hypothetical protein